MCVMPSALSSALTLQGAQHFYPTYGSRIHKDATLAGKYDKAYLIGVFGDLALCLVSA